MHAGRKSFHSEAAINHAPLCPERHTRGATLDDKEVVAGSHFGQGGDGAGRNGDALAEEGADTVRVSTCVHRDGAAHV